jgi:hypothetical protein
MANESIARNVMIRVVRREHSLFRREEKNALQDLSENYFNVQA